MIQARLLPSHPGGYFDIRENLGIIMLTDQAYSIPVVLGWLSVS